MSDIFLEFCGIKFTGLLKKELLSKRNEFSIITTVNSEFIVSANRDYKFKSIINSSYATFDGQIPFLLAKFFYRKHKINFEKISGSDFVYDLLDDASIFDKRVFFLGAEQASNYSALLMVRDKYDISVDGFSPDYTSDIEIKTWNDSIFEKLERFKPHYLFVAFGAPKQEFWIFNNREKLKEIGVTLVIGCGGSLDFLSGKIKRAPKIIQTIGLEGVYRFLMEPKLFRFKRLIRSMLVFYYFILDFFR